MQETIAAMATRLRLSSLYLKPLQRLRRTPPSRRLNLLFVCKGNICRSAYAEYRFRKVLAERGIENIVIASCGLEAIPGAPAYPSTVRVARQRGLDIDPHKTQPVDTPLLNRADLIVVMEPAQLRQLRQYAPIFTYKTILLGALVLDPGGNLIIGDPWGKPDEDFEKCFDQIDRALLVLADQLPYIPGPPNRQRQHAGTA